MLARVVRQEWLERSGSFWKNSFVYSRAEGKEKEGVLGQSGWSVFNLWAAGFQGKESAGGVRRPGSESKVSGCYLASAEFPAQVTLGSSGFQCKTSNCCPACLPRRPLADACKVL